MSDPLVAEARLPAAHGIGADLPQVEIAEDRGEVGEEQLGIGAPRQDLR
jgi:hypothetical protein